MDNKHTVIDFKFQVCRLCVLLHEPIIAYLNLPKQFIYKENYLVYKIAVYLLIINRCTAYLSPHRIRSLRYHAQGDTFIWI